VLRDYSPSGAAMTETAKDVFRSTLRGPDAGGKGVAAQRRTLRKAFETPDMGDPRWPIERVHVDHQMRRVLPRRRDRGLPPGKRRRQPARLQRQRLARSSLRLPVRNSWHGAVLT
jgi:hypothetical protein